MIDRMSLKRQTAMYGIAAVLIGVIIIVGSIIFGPLGILSTGPTRPGSAGTVPLLIQLTDPPNVPVGTQWLNLTYSGLEVSLIGGGTQTGWVQINSTVTVNLLDLVNMSKTIGITQVPNGSSVSQLRFDIISVQINVNGTAYNVTTINNKLVVPIVTVPKLENLSSILLELSPTVTEIITGNLTAPVFVLIPSATAVIRQGSDVNQSQSTLGAQSHLTNGDRALLEGANGITSVLSTSLSVSGNRTMFSITIKNTGNVSVAIEAVSLHGQFNISSSSSRSTCSSTSTLTTSSSEDGSTDSGSNSCTTSEQEVEYPNALVFAANGSSLTQVSSNEGFQSTNAPVLQPGQNLTLSLNEVIVLTQGDSQNLHTILAFPILGNSYSVYAGLSNSAETVVQVNATAA